MLLIIERLGNWNPQLFRELKGRLTTRNILLATGISILGQILLLMYHFNERTGEVNAKNLVTALDWILPFTLVLSGVYMLIGDMAQEQRRGTLNFIRLSPQSSQSILIGKMLGVPVLLYLATALTVPLNCWAASKAAIPLGFVLTFYVMLGAICGFFYSASLFYTLLGEAQAWVGTVLAVVFIYPFLLLLNVFLEVVKSDSALYYSGLEEFKWFYLSVGSNLAIAYCFSLLSICLGTYWIWQFLNRRFNNPNATLVSKLQSYLLVTCVNLWMLGFSLPQINSSSFNITVGFSFVFFVLPFCFLILIGAVSPHRQALQDWMRYSRNSKNSKKGSFLPASVWDLILGEKSPAPIAIAINLVISAAIWIPWMMLPQHRDSFNYIQPHQYIIALLLNANLILICAAIAQILLLLMKSEKRKLWAASAVSAVVIFPLLAIASYGSQQSLNMWLITAFPIVAVQSVSTTTIFLTILGQWSILTLLNLQLVRQLRKAGESSSRNRVSA